MAGMIERGNVMDPELAIFFLSELDGMIQSDIMLHAPEEIISYDNEEQELLLRKPHDALYVHFLVAMIRQCQEEFEGYNNAQEIVNEKLETFREWYVAHYDPAETASRSYAGGTSADAFGFAYLTAYGLAVKHGYGGTEEEWLESLIGQPGEAARMRYDEDREVIQWGVGNTWYDMFPLSALRDPAVDDIVNKVQAAVDTARGHAHDAGVSSGEASAAATAASSAATDAAQSAQSAGEHADAAKTEAQKASSAANAVGSAVVAAREQADRAEAARTAAERAEQVAGAAAVTATQEAGGAAQSARDAETYAGQAYSAGQQATKYASEAYLSKQDAAAAQEAAETAAGDAATQAQTAGSHAQRAHDAAGAAAVFKGDTAAQAQNANKYAQQAEAAAERAEAAADRAEAAGGNGSGNGSGNADLTGYATEAWVKQWYQPKGSFLTEDMLGAAIEDVLSEAATSGKFDGADGRGIKSITRTSGNGAAGTVDTYTITFTDNTKSTFQVRNGTDGSPGKDGKDGTDGSPGKDGSDGQDGYTPVKGTDYFTAADRAEMVQAVVAALPKYAGEVEVV